MILPFFGALSLATATLMEKITLKKERVSVKFYQTYIFFAIVLVMMPFIFFVWDVSSEAYSLKNILIMLGVVILSVTANWFVFYSMKWEKLSKIEPARLTEPLFTILLTIVFSLFFGSIYERNMQAIVPAIIASAALVLSHIKKHHIKFSKYFMAAMAGSLFFASELVVSKLILEHYSSFSFYFVRCLFVFLLTFLIFRPRLFYNVKPKTVWQIFVTAAIWIAYRVIIYQGYKSFGIISTTLVVMLGPVLVYFFAWKFLRERPTWKNIAASIVILGCVLYVSVF